MNGALLGVLALYSGFFSEMVVLGIITPIYACWRVSGTECYVSLYLLVTQISVHALISDLSIGLNYVSLQQ